MVITRGLGDGQMKAATDKDFIEDASDIPELMTNDVFAINAWYFRNAIVRANYNDLKNGICETTEYLELFLRNLLLNEKHTLHNWTLHISGTFKEPE